MAEVINGILINEVKTKNIMTKSSLPVGGYSVNPYVGCTHACKYCYASFMKRFTGHKEEWGTFLDVKHWPEIKNPKKSPSATLYCFPPVAIIAYIKGTSYVHYSPASVPVFWMHPFSRTFTPLCGILVYYSIPVLICQYVFRIFCFSVRQADTFFTDAERIKICVFFRDPFLLKTFAHCLAVSDPDSV